VIFLYFREGFLWIELSDLVYEIQLKNNYLHKVN